MYMPALGVLQVQVQSPLLQMLDHLAQLGESAKPAALGQALAGIARQHHHSRVDLVAAVVLP
jgi:hypothetical protein